MGSSGINAGVNLIRVTLSHVQLLGKARVHGQQKFVLMQFVSSNVTPRDENAKRQNENRGLSTRITPLRGLTPRVYPVGLWASNDSDPKGIRSGPKPERKG